MPLKALYSIEWNNDCTNCIQICLELHKPEQGRAAEGVDLEATVHWTNIITTRALRDA